jgi:hypothetical protein
MLLLTDVDIMSITHFSKNNPDICIISKHQVVYQDGSL